MSKIIAVFSRTIVQALFCYMMLFFWVSAGNIAFSYRDFPGKYTFWAFILLFFLLFLLPFRKVGDVNQKWPWFLWLVILVLSLPFSVLQLTLGVNQIEPILVFFADNNIEDIIKIGTGSFLIKIYTYTSFLAILLFSVFYMLKRTKGFTNVLLLFAVLLFAFHPMTRFLVRQIMPNKLHGQFDVAQNIQGFAVTQKPLKQKNMVIVYLESVERTYKNLESTRIAFKDINALSDTSIDATNITQSFGSTYTIAGIVSTHCGVPLVPKGLNHAFFGIQDSAIQVDNFMPAVRCLGDQLSEDGYTLSYMNGASLKKFSKRGFLSAHGYTRFYDEDSISATEKEGRTNIWGLNDEILFEKARIELETLHNANKPFVFSMLTLSTHGPDAFLDTDCQKTTETDSGIPKAIECTGRLLRDFYDFADKKGMLENTVFVVMSDHLAMKNTLENEINANQDIRRNLFFIKDGSIPRTIEKQGLAIDIFPTLLETLGYEIKGHRANLGVSLYSDETSIIQQYGDENQVSELFKNNHNLSEFLWREADVPTQ